MASSNGKNRYPLRLHEKRKACNKIRSIDHNCYLSNLQMVKERVGVDVWDALKTSSVGVIVKLREVPYIWSPRTVEYLLTHQLAIEHPFEIWSLVDDQPIRFFLYEFEEITGLNCAPFKVKDKWDADHKAFWEEMNVSTAEGPCLKELQVVLDICKDWSFEKRRMVGWLCIMSIGILGISSTSRIPLEQAKRVLDPEAFESYPWGRVGFNSLVESVKIATYGVKQSNTLHRCVHVLLIWAYESILGLGECYGNKRICDEVPLLSYAGSRPRVNFAEFFTHEKKAHDNKVRVRYFVEREGEDINTSWDEDNKDVKVSNLIEDIRENRLDTRAWDVVQGSVSKKRTVPEKSLKMKKVAKIHAAKAGTTEISVECYGERNETNLGQNSGETRVPFETEKAIVGIVDLMKVLTEKVESMDKNLADKVLASMKPAIYAQVNAQVNERLSNVNEKIATLEDALKSLKERVEAGDNKEKANSNDKCSDRATSKALSWKVQTKATSQDDFPIRCVVKRGKQGCKKTEKLNGMTKQGGPNNVLDCKKLLTQKLPHKDIVQKGVATSETWSDPILRQKVKTLGSGLDVFVRGLKIMDDNTPLPKRVPHLSQSQQPPFIGNSTVKRIISGVIPSLTAYDPFGVINERIYKKMLDFMQHDDMEPFGTWDSSVEFYKVIITPRTLWPHSTYGWLGVSQICAAMLMFHKRSLRTPSPYNSSRITFLNQWFVCTWVLDYKDFDPKTWVLPDSYREVFNGTYPADSVTNKKWLIDVDHVYACHFINDNHWIALDIDLVREKINVYDSILTTVKDDKKILNYCRPFTRMIPAILNVMILSRKKSDKQFLVKRLKTIPQNINPGDCGVYALKYIECLAIGCTFGGLSDRNIQGIRCKLAAEIFDEVREPQSREFDGELRLRDSE